MLLSNWLNKRTRTGGVMTQVLFGVWLEERTYVFFIYSTFYAYNVHIEASGDR